MRKQSITTTISKQVRSMTATHKSIKVIYNNEIRRFPFPLSNSSIEKQFNELEGHIKQTFALPSSVQLKLTYVDEENDVITISSRMELEEALLCCNAKILRINVSIESSPKSIEEIDGKAEEKQEEAQKVDVVQSWKAKLAENKIRYQAQLQELKEKYNLSDVPESILVKQLAMSKGNIQFVVMRQNRRKEIQQNKQKKIEEIAAKYPNQIATLKEMGYPMQPPICYWLLKKFNGDLVKVITALSNPSNASKKKFNRLDAREKYAVQLVELSEMGFNGPRRLWLLHKFDGDISKVVEKLQKKSSNTELMLEKYSKQLEELSSKGYNCLPVNIRLLNKFDGDVSKVENKLANRKTTQHCNRKFAGKWKRHGRLQNHFFKRMAPNHCTFVTK